MGIDSQSASYAAFLLRLALGTMFLAHGVVLKYFSYTLSGTAKFFESINLPGWSAYLVFGAEVIGGILLILGVQVRAVSLALLPILLGALWVHSGNGWVFTSPNGGWEYPLYLSLLSVVQALLGAGAFALSSSDILARPLLVERQA